MKAWQFNILFFVGVGGAVFLLVGPQVGLEISTNPTALAGIGSILAYILTQKSSLTKKSDDKTPRKKNIENNEKNDGEDPASTTDNDEEERTHDEE